MEADASSSPDEWPLSKLSLVSSTSGLVEETGCLFRRFRRGGGLKLDSHGKPLVLQKRPGVVE